MNAPTRIVVTGASSGIGAATAIAFARQGSHLVLGARGVAGLEAVAERCREEGGTADIRVVDVTDAAAVAAFAASAKEILGEIDLWFSDVGIGVVGKYQDVPVADHRQVIETNLIGHMNDAHAAIPIFLAQDHGIWVNMISVGGFLASPYAAAYAASKFGLRGFSEALRGELSKHPRIHVCDVYPTFVDTPGVDHGGNYTGAKLSYPPGALAPEKVAKAVVRLARRPRNTTAIGMPAIAMKITQFAAPNLSAAIMNGFMDVWAKRADRDSDTSGTIYAPPEKSSGIHSGQFADRATQSKVPIVAAVGAGAAFVGALIWHRRRGDR